MLTPKPCNQLCQLCLQETRLNSIDAMIDPADFSAELAQINADSIGWIPLEEGVYLYVSDENATKVLVVGVPQAGAVLSLVI